MNARTLRWTLLPACLALFGLLLVLGRMTPGEAEAQAPPKATPAADGTPRFILGPYLQSPTKTSMTVMWETDLPGTATVEYGLPREKPLSVQAARLLPPNFTQKVTTDKQATVQEVTLSDLKAGTQYLYRVTTTTPEGKTVASDVHAFMTAVEGDQPFTFTVIGDTQRNPTVTGRICKLMWALRPHFVVHCGDVVDEGPDKKQWVGDLFVPGADLWARVPLMPCIGNHEKNHAYYYQYFSLPDPEYYYTYRYGNAQFFVLDTNTRRKLDATGEQYQWLDKELAKSDATWKFVYHHHPAYSSDDDDFGDTWRTASPNGDVRVRALVPLYEKHNVDVVFNGHIHVYERTLPIREGKVDRKKGTVYLTSGGGGGALENFAPTPTWFKGTFRSDYHFCYVNITGNRFELKAYDQDNRLFDFFEIVK
jgi:predicted phosphodiesterase